MPEPTENFRRRLRSLTRWPFGVGLTTWRYLWRTTPMYRDEVEGSLPEDAPPELPPHLDPAEIQRVEDGTGPLFRRRYRARMLTCELTPEELVERVTAKPDRVAPSEFANFEKLDGDEGEMRPGDDYVVRMAGPWDGPVRVALVEPGRFRLVTLPGHLEAGQIEFRARADGEHTVFEIEAWARSKDRLTDLLYNRLRMSKEVQLHMWVSTLERVAELAGGRIDGGLEIHTRKVPAEALDGGS